jgi:uncharacterized membrane protein YgcG
MLPRCVAPALAQLGRARHCGYAGCLSGAHTIIIIPILTLALLLALLIKFGRRKPAGMSPPVPDNTRVDGGLYDSFGLTMLPAAQADGGLFGDAAPDDSIAPGGGSFGGGGASGDWSDGNEGGDDGNGD